MHINIYNQLVAIPIPSENSRLQKIVFTFTSISTKTCIDLSIKDYATKITNILMLINLTGSCLQRDVCTQCICMPHLHSSIKIHLFHLSSFLSFFNLILFNLLSFLCVCGCACFYGVEWLSNLLHVTTA